MLPRILAADDRLGFGWARPDGRPATLVELLSLDGAEPHRWLPTHLEAVDDLLIEVAGRFGEVLGGGRGPARGEHDELATAYAAIDRASAEYAAARAVVSLPVDPRSGQILGTGALMSIRCREALGLMGPTPFAGSLDAPPVGVIAGQGRLTWVDEDVPERGARWLVVTDDGLRLPATLSMLLHDSSGVDRDSAVREHEEALRRVTSAVGAATPADPVEASGALDWLLFDWLMAHRDGPDSGGIDLGRGGAATASMVVAAVAASVAVRRRFDPSLGSG